MPSKRGFRSVREIKRVLTSFNSRILHGSRQGRPFVDRKAHLDFLLKLLSRAKTKASKTLVMKKLKELEASNYQEPSAKQIAIWAKRSAKGHMPRQLAKIKDTMSYIERFSEELNVTLDVHIQFPRAKKILLAAEKLAKSSKDYRELSHYWIELSVAMLESKRPNRKEVASQYAQKALKLARKSGQVKVTTYVEKKLRSLGLD